MSTEHIISAEEQLQRDQMIMVEDNILTPEEFRKISDVLVTNSGFPWFFNDIIDYDSDSGDIDKYQFVHNFYNNDSPTSELYSIVEPILAIIAPTTIFRVKANLLTRTSKIVENRFHIDMGDLSEEQQKGWTTSVFYVNTNNGYTLFEDGTKVKSVANKMITFPSNMRHTGTSCTDEQIRVVINFNFFHGHDKPLSDPGRPELVSRPTLYNHIH